MNDETFEELLEDAAEVHRSENREWDRLLSKLENWTEELASRGPKAMPEVYREMAVLVSPSNPRCEPCIDFDHQKGYE